MTNVNPVARAFNRALSADGFRRSGSDWSRRGGETLEVVNLQRSDWGPQYYGNYGVWLLPLGVTERPRVHQAHIVLRLGKIVSDGVKLDELMRLDVDMPEAEREEAIAKTLRDEFRDFAERCRTLEGIRALLRAGRIVPGSMRKEAKALLGLPGDA